MFNSDALRRLVAVVLLITGLVALPMPALAAGEDNGQAADTEDQGVVEQAIDWILQLIRGEDEGDIGHQIDPMGLA